MGGHDIDEGRLEINSSGLSFFAKHGITSLAKRRNFLSRSGSKAIKSMKPTFFRLLILVASTFFGVAITVFLSDHYVSDQLISPIDNAVPIKSVNYRPSPVVISIPVDGAFYIGKHRFDLSEINEVVARSLASTPNDERVVYLKPATDVKAETLALVIKEVKLAGADRIEFVLDKKKVIP